MCQLKANAYIYKKNLSDEGYALRNKTMHLCMQIINQIGPPK